MAAADTKRTYIPLPQTFVTSLPTSLAGLAEALDSEAPVSVRLNPFKPYSFSDFSGLRPVPWMEPGEAYYLNERPVFTADPVFHGGAYYVQEAGSMFIGWLLRRVLDSGDFDRTGLRVLDLCAAPGGKTTHIASVTGPRSAVVANEVIRSRAKILAENVQKWGSGNVAVTSNDPADFGRRLPGFFDVIVVDAPCSGEGMFRKDHGARAEWSPENVQLCAARQRRIVSDVWDALRPGGVMIYSTCTFNASEDEENVRWIAEELGGDILSFTDIPAGIEDSGTGWHFYPHRVMSEGFFAATIRKTGGGTQRTLPSRKSGVGSGLIALSKTDAARAAEWIAETLPVERFATGGDGMVYGYTTGMYDVVSTLIAARFGLAYSGVQMGEMIRDILKPSHALALYHGMARNRTHVTELDETAAMEYLRKGTSTTLLPPTVFTEGLNLVTYNGIALGWAKRIGHRYNNLYPSGWRILHY